MSEEITLFDAHVHVYPGADVAALLSAAAKHLGEATNRAGASRWRGYLLLTEIAGTSWFDFVADSSHGREFGDWRVSGFPHDPLMLEAQRGDCSLHIVAGRQIVTAERIEVHALAMRQTIADGQTLRATLEEVRASDALVVLPWGVGKWLGRRGRLVAEALAADLGTVWLSDNGGRPWFWRDALLARAPAAGRPVLRGSDPLPLPGEERRVGSFGCWLRGSVATAAALIARIRSSTPADLHPYGNSESLARFLRNQSALRLRRRDGG